MEVCFGVLRLRLFLGYLVVSPLMIAFFRFWLDWLLVHWNILPIGETFHLWISYLIFIHKNSNISTTRKVLKSGDEVSGSFTLTELSYSSIRSWVSNASRPNGRGGMTRSPAPPVGLKVEEAMTSAEINAALVCLRRTPNFLPRTHNYDPKTHDLIEGARKCIISRQEAQAKFNEYREAQGSHDEVYNDGSKMNERVGAAAAINRHFQSGETACHQLSKRLPDNSTIFAPEATVISLALNYYQQIGPVHQNVVVYSDSMPCLQAIEGENTRTLLFVISWTCSGYWVTKTHMFISAGYQATVALREIEELTN